MSKEPIRKLRNHLFSKTLTIRTKLLLNSLCALFLMALFVCTYYPGQMKRKAIEHLREKVQVVTEMTALGVGVAMESGSFDAILQTLGRVDQDSGILFLVVANEAGDVLASREAPGIVFDEDLLSTKGASFEESSINFVAPIIYGAESSGKLALGYSLEAMNKEIAAEQRKALFVIAVVFVVGTLMMGIVSHRITRPINRLRDAAIALSEGRHDVSVSSESNDEIGDLGRTFNMMASQIAKDTGELQIQKNKLARSVIEAEKASKLAKAANQSKSAFLANMSHEVRTPMNGILGLTELALDSELSIEQRECLQGVMQSGKNMLYILNDILDFSKIEAGQMKLERHDFDLAAATNEAVNIIGLKAKEAGIEVITTIDPDVPKHITADPVRLRQILLNLVGNACKFTTEGKITTRVSRLDSDEYSCTLSFSIADTGIGIPKERQAKIFSSFTQVDESTTRKYGGTGLGTTISKRLVEMMGGELSCASPTNTGDVGGPGSTFEFTLIVGLSESIEHEPYPRGQGDRARQTFAHSSAARNKLILMAEDNKVNQMVGIRLLEKNGFNVEVVDNGQQALDAARTGKYSLILMDLHMPVMGGIEVTRLIREWEEGKASRLPIVAMTASALVGDREKCLEAGMDDYVSKPIDRTELLSSLDRWLCQDEGSSISKESV